jgi:hypothetical protein
MRYRLSRYCGTQQEVKYGRNYYVLNEDYTNDNSKIPLPFVGPPDCVCRGHKPNLLVTAEIILR